MLNYKIDINYFEKFLKIFSENVYKTRDLYYNKINATETVGENERNKINMVKQKDYSNYKNSTDYIEYLCQKKGITVKEMCEILDFNIRGFISNYSRQKLKPERAIKMIEYLDGDMIKYMKLPTRAEYKKSQKESEGK